jgi:iron complex outermembrane receptor protein
MRKKFRGQLTALRLALAMPLAALALPALGEAADLTALSLEDLAQTKVTSASKFEQPTLQAPSAVTVITRDDIRRYGYRTLADIMRALPGVFVSHDRIYGLAGIRGFLPPGEYGSRLLLMVDGYRLNDNVYDQAVVGSEFPLDVDLIERVEFVPGPSSSLYGSNAFFGVLNVVTRRGDAVDGLEVSGSWESHDTWRGRATYGGRIGETGSFLVSGTAGDSQGDDLYFPEFDDPSLNDGWARGADWEDRRLFFSSFHYGGWSGMLGYSDRDKGVPTGIYGIDFNEPGNHSDDTLLYGDLRYTALVGDKREATGRLYFGSYDYDADWYYAQSGYPTNRDEARGRWVGAELKIVDSSFSSQLLVYGIEYQSNRRQDQKNFDVEAVYVDSRLDSDVLSLFVQDEITLSPEWLLNLGLRYDRPSLSDPQWSPRVAAIWRPDSLNAVKLIYGRSFRAPNVYELFYADAQLQAQNPNLKPEEIQTVELDWDHYLDVQTRLGARAYFYRVDDWIVAGEASDGSGRTQFRNLETVEGTGLELEAERLWQSGARVRASYALQSVPGRIHGVLNQAPQNLFKLNAAAPLGVFGLEAGFELQYVDQRTTLSGEVDDYLLANATLLRRGGKGEPEVSFSVYNLFDEEYRDPAVDSAVDPDSENNSLAVRRREWIEQPGRTFRLKLTYRF